MKNDIPNGTSDSLGPRVLIIDDDPSVGRALKKLIEREFKYRVCFPTTVERLQDTVFYEAFDTVVIDAKLDRWKLPITIFGEDIYDGIDLARVYCEFQEKCLIVLFGPKNLPNLARVQDRINGLKGCKIRTIDRPLPSNQKDINTILKVLEPRIEETEIIHEESPVFQPTKAFEALLPEERSLRRRLLYRQTSDSWGKWLNRNLQKNGDSSWTVLCGGNVQKKYYGPLLSRRQNSPDVKIRTRYPLDTELSKLAATEMTLPFVIWNTRDVSILGKQFDRRSEIPPTPVDDFGRTLLDDFGMRVAAPCALAYNQDDSKTVIEWCQSLSPFGQLDVVRAVFKSLKGDLDQSTKLAARCKEADLVQVVDVYAARVEKLMPQENKAIIELRNSTGEEDFSAPFDLTKLARKGVKETDQCFEYTVALDERENSFGRIELTE